MRKLIVVLFLLSTSLVLTGNAPGMGGSQGAPNFSAQPDEAEIFKAHIFDEPLIPIGADPMAADNKALADALKGYSSRTNLDDFSSLTGFLARFPNSAWSGSLLLHLGTEYYNFGYYSKALDSWQRAWEDLKDTTDPKGKAQADRALGELARMDSKLGRMDELNNLLASVTNRSLTGPATQLIHHAQEAIWLMQNRPGISFRCGPMAMDSILADKNPAKASNPLIIQSQSTTNGFALFQVASLSKQLGMNYQMAFRSPGAAWVLPAVVHWKVGHYAALLRRDGDRFLVKDHTFQSSLWMSASALEAESSGYFLIPPGPLPAGWRPVSQSESQNVRGKGHVSGQDANQTGSGPNVTQSGGIAGAGASSTADPGNIGGNPVGPSSCAAGGVNAGGQASTPPHYFPFRTPGIVGGPRGMTQYTFDTMLASLCLIDNPVGYKPPVGPWVEFIAAYNQYEANQPATFSYANLGPKWTCNWISYITDNPTSPGENVSCYQPGGGTLTFSGFNSTNGTFAPEAMTQGILTQTSSSSYQMQFGTGVRWIFALSNGATGSSRRIFLTQIIDATGNSVTLNYDSSFRLVNIMDAIGQNTTFSYTNANFPYAITAVQDPFGRTAHFEYNASGLLSKITDMLGITSQYTYGANDFINNLTTPYGTTMFSSGNTNGGPWLQATDPLGASELVEAPFGGLDSVDSEFAAVVPTNMLVTPIDEFLTDRNTYFWGKQAYAMGAGNPYQATIYHFLHSLNSGIESGVLESIKEPLESRVWYNYPGMESGIQIGPQSVNEPIAVGRVLDDGSSQTSYYQYNALGRITHSADPIGRSFTYVYSTNNVDLLQVIMTSHGKQEVQSMFTYNLQHEPLTITDASGQTATNTYNSRGQLLSTTDPLGESTTFAYDTNGYLLSITGALQNASDVISFTYDSFGRMRTKTDTEGYTLTYAYDPMDRITNITFPDGTSDQFVYSNLDLTASVDRLGRWTTNTYNANRQLIVTEDPLGRVTRYDYCACGALEALFDPAGNVTWWDHDVQSRVTGKHYADGSGITYTYESTTSRLHSRFDEKGQQTLYQYYDDDNLQSIHYPNALIATPTVSYTYDTNYNRIVGMQDGIGATLYTYNPVTPIPSLGAGQLASVSGPLPNSTVTYQYDPLGRVASRAINGVAQATAYDVLGRPITVTNALGAFKYSYVDETVRLASEAYPNGQTNLYSYYNNLGDQRLLQIQHFYPNGSLLSAFGYAYNPVGQITAWTNQWDTLPTRIWYPGYDAADQLTNVLVAGGSSPVTNYAYAYDLAGNRTLVATNSVQTQYYYNTLNQIAGSSATLPNVTYKWDAENRLVAINNGANSSRFSYDGLGRRVEIEEMTNGVVMTNNYYLWCGNDICEARDGTGANVLRRLYGQGESLVGLAGATNYFYARDHLGSVRDALNENGVLATRYDYSPYGQQTTAQQDLITTLGYTGDFSHRASGLSLTLYRALDTELGRWLSRDPIGERVSAGLYSYVLNNPINFLDIMGTSPEGPGCYAPNFPSYIVIRGQSYPVSWSYNPDTGYYEPIANVDGTYVGIDGPIPLPAQSNTLGPSAI